MDRVVVDALNSLPEHNRYIRGLRAWVGFRYADCPFVRQQRFDGKPKYNFFKSLALAFDGVISFSHSPLRLVLYTGFATSILALVMIALVLYWRFVTDAPFVGYATLVTAILFLGSVQLLAFGILGEYVGRIYDEVRGRPHYIVKEMSPKAVSPGRSSGADVKQTPSLAA
jgi:dolichol-phosphate mannosyltransferase